MKIRCRTSMHMVCIVLVECLSITVKTRYRDYWLYIYKYVLSDFANWVDFTFVCIYAYIDPAGAGAWCHGFARSRVWSQSRSRDDRTKEFLDIVAARLQWGTKDSNKEKGKTKENDITKPCNNVSQLLCLIRWGDPGHSRTKFWKLVTSELPSSYSFNHRTHA